MIVQRVDALARLLKRSRLAPVWSLVRACAPASLRTWVQAERAKTLQLVPEKELGQAYRESLRFLCERHGPESLGDYLEFGVFRGSSLLCMHRALQDLGLDHVRLFGFDSFEGLPETQSAEDRQLPWEPGSYKSSYRATKRRLAKAGAGPDRVFLLKGWYEENLTDALRKEYDITHASVIMIDCDLYSSTKTALSFCAPLVVNDAIVVFDDWDAGVGLAQRDLGEKRAFDEFLTEHPYLDAEEFASYYHTEAEHRSQAKLFLLTRNQISRGPL